MANKNTHNNQTTSTTTATAEVDDRSYDEIRKSIINIADQVEQKKGELKKQVIAAIIRLQNIEKKSAREIRQILKNDLENPGFVHRTTINDAIKYAFATAEEKAKIEEENKLKNERKRLAYSQNASGNGQATELIQRTGNEDNDNDNIDEDDPDAIRAAAERKKEIKMAGSISRQQAKVVDQGELESVTDDEDDEDEIGTVSGLDIDNDDEDDHDTSKLAKQRHKIPITDPVLLNDITQLLKSGKTFIIEIDGNLKPLRVIEGQPFS